ncbi:uncharacterized protein LOC123294985 [Chrysoperla carnea]|uniref:uncharacterized protein LOC123294985 n=1 Tax=Chrysoperla carnea TaxID=189513 RepID=UPI001D084453|nr:uncharacterized protein LOC123294985 [Chrysoperla carnea]
MKEISDDKKHFEESQKNNTYISVHIQPKSSNRLSDANEPITKSNEQVQDNKIIGKENDPQKYFVKCNKSDQPLKKFCKECKNYRTKLKVTKLDEQIAENKKLNEKSAEITSYVSKFVALFGLNEKNDAQKGQKQHLCTKKCRTNHAKHYLSSQEHITKKYDVGRKSMSKDIVNYENGENRTIESYSAHSIEKYKTKPATPPPNFRKKYSKRIKENEDEDDVLSKLSLNSTKCRKNCGTFDQSMTREKRFKVDNEKLLDIELIKKTTNIKRKQELKTEVKANRKHLIHMQRILIKKLSEQKPDKKYSSSQFKIKAIESRNDVKVVNKSETAAMLDQEEQLVEKSKPKSIQITKKFIYLGKNGHVRKYTYKPGKIQEICHEIKDEAKEVQSSSNTRRSETKGKLIKKYIQYPTILWPHTSCVVENLDSELKLAQFFENICDSQHKSSMEKINELIIPTSNLLKCYKKSDNRSTNISNKKFGTTISNDLSITNAIGIRNSDPICKQVLSEISGSEHQLKRSHTVPLYLGDSRFNSETAVCRKSLNTRDIVNFNHVVKYKRRECRATVKQQMTSKTSMIENECAILPKSFRRKMIRTRSEIQSIEEFYRRYRRTASLPPPNVSNPNRSAQNSTINTSLRSNANRPRMSKNPNNNNWNRHTQASTSSARSSIDISYDIEKQYMDSIKRHLEYLKQEQENINIKRNNTRISSSSDTNSVRRSQQNMFLRSLPKTACTELNDPINTGKIRFSIDENKITSPIESKNMLQRTSKLNNIMKMNNEVKSEYQKLKSIEIKPKLEKLLRKSDKLLSWRLTKNLKNIQEINKCEESPSIMVSCDPLPANNIKVTVSFEQSPLKQEVFTDKTVKSYISSTDSITSESHNYIPDPPNQKSSESIDKKNIKAKKHVSIRVSTDSQAELQVLSNATTSRSADTKRESLSMDGNESKTEIELALLKRKHLDALERIRSEHPDTEAEQIDSNESMDIISKSILSLAAVDSIILKKEAIRRKSFPNQNKKTEKYETGRESSDEKTEATEDFPLESSGVPDYQGLPDSAHEDLLYPSISQIIHYDPDKSNKRIVSSKLKIGSPVTPKSNMDISSFVESTLAKAHAERSNLFMRKDATTNTEKSDNMIKANKFMNIAGLPRKNTQTNEKTNGSSPIIKSNSSLLNDYMPNKTSTSASIRLKDGSGNLRRGSSGKSFYLKRSEVDLNERFSKIIFLENEEAAAKNKSTTLPNLEILADSNTSSNVPSLTNINSKLKKIDLVDDTSLTETERFNLILNSYTTLKKLIAKPTEGELTEGLPPNVLRNGKILPGATYSVNSDEFRDFILDNDKLSSHSEITIEALSSNPEEFTHSESHLRFNMPESNEQLVEEASSTPLTKEISSMKLRSFQKPDCNCEDKSKTLMEEILRQANCTCFKHGKGNILETCTCIQKTDKLQYIQVVCGHISDKDRCRCKMDDFNGSQRQIESFRSTSLGNGVSQILSAPIKIHENSEIDLNPEQIGACFRRGFRADNVALSDAYCLIKRGEDKLLCIRSNLAMQPKQMGVNFSEQRTPLDFLIALGFSVDEASIALRNEIVKNRLSAAITEARIWCNFVSIPQGTLLYLLAYKARTSTMRYFLQMVEAIINSRIPDAVQLDGFIKLLDKLESGHLPMKLIFGSSKMYSDKDEGRNVQKQLASLFENMHQIAAKEAALHNRKFTHKNKKLLEHLTTYYRPGLYNHLETIAKYVGRGQLVSLVQMEAAIIYLSRMVKAADVNYEEFENYCGMNPEK